MVHVPAGEFLMGSSQAQIEDAVAMCMAAGSTEAECEQGVQDEMPRHPVFLDAYWIDQTEVTNAQYRHCVDAGACEPPAVCDPGHPAFDDLSKADHPVVCVDWSDAQDYCEWAGARLPTEAEWEKAARGTVGLVYPWGESFECSRANLDDETQHDDNLVPGGSDCDGYVMTAPVGSFLTGGSPYGALDMVGNVWEWVADWYGRDYYERSPQPNPQGPVAGEVRSLRGGSWVVSRPNWARSAHRSWLGPEERDRDVGFRCCMAAGQE
jgi:formylglycine-generating enzyme required for sulfatase activity